MLNLVDECRDVLQESSVPHSTTIDVCGIGENALHCLEELLQERHVIIDDLYFNLVRAQQIMKNSTN